MRYLLTIIFLIISWRGYAIEASPVDPARDIQARFQGHVPSKLLPFAFLNYERVAWNLRLLGGKTVLDPSNAEMTRYPMPPSAVGLGDTVFGTPLVPSHAADALLFFLFPYPNIFQATTIGPDPISWLKPSTLGQLVRACEEYGKRLADCTLDAEVLAWENNFTDALLEALNFNRDKYYDLDSKLEAFHRWTTVRAFAKRVASLEELATERERAEFDLRYPGQSFASFQLKQAFRGAEEFWRITETELKTLRHSSDEHEEVLQSFACFVLGQSKSVSFSTFENRTKDLGKARLINLIVRGMVDERYGADLLSFNIQSRLALFFWKKNQWAIEGGDLTPLTEFYSTLMGSVLASATPSTSAGISLTFETIEKNPHLFFQLSLEEREKIIKECSGAFVPIPMHQAVVGDKKFSDCVETAIFNLAVALVHQVKDGKVVLDPGLLPPCPLRTYLETHPGDLSDYARKHSEFANLIANLPGVQYLKTTSDGKRCEVRPGLISTLNVLSFLLNIGAPLDHVEGAPITERLEAISKFINEKVGNPVAMAFNDKVDHGGSDGKPRWSSSKREYTATFSLEYGREGDRGTFTTSLGHEEFQWVAGMGNRAHLIFPAAKTPEDLLMAAPLVNNPESFAIYFERLQVVGGMDHLKYHLFQMQLTSLEMQKVVFKKVYNQKGFQTLALAIIQRLDGTGTFPTALSFAFLEGEDAIPSDEFLCALATIYSKMFSCWNSFGSRRADGEPLSFWYWCVANGKENVIEAGLPRLSDFNIGGLPESRRNLTNVLAYLRKMPAIKELLCGRWDPVLSLTIETKETPDNQPIFDFLTGSWNFIEKLMGLEISSKMAFLIMEKSPKLRRFDFTVSEDGGWTQDIMKSFVDCFLSRPTDGEKDLRIIFSWEESEILDCLRSLNPEYLRRNLLSVNRKGAPIGWVLEGEEPPLTLVDVVLQELDGAATGSS
jgi:hypothetical protein